VKILLDENLNWRLGRFLPGHEVKSVPLLGWAGLSNGKLLARAQDQFDVLITMDGSMSSQQNLAKFQIALIALRAHSNRLEDTSPLMPEVLATLPLLKPGKVLIVGA
jgi:predicted nuclease of predicted toxin-antitoxin system